MNSLWMDRLDKRISVSIRYDSPNRINRIEGNGINFEEAMLDLLNRLFELEREFQTNNIKSGGHTAFLPDVEIVLNNKENYIEQIKNMIGEDVVNDRLKQLGWFDD
ncbi:MAG: hypothetical protein IKT40_03365 [Bacilli bacterium]|nr:hypothetical protein [Bacilli bacterium]